MKRLLYMLLISLLLGCKPSTKQGEFVLLPTPKEIFIDGNSSLKPKDLPFISQIDKISMDTLDDFINSQQSPSANNNQVHVEFVPEDSMKPEGYALEIKDRSISIQVRDKVGLFYALQSLSQIIEDATDQAVYLPNITIKDFPSLAYRAIHLDVKHHLNRKAYYYQMIDKLARFKVNAIIAEVEDKLRFEKESTIASDDAMSIEEWNALSAYALSKNIEISPLIQGLGHASFILKHDKYVSLRDDPKSDWAFNPLDPKTYELQFDLYRDAFKAFPSGRYLHVGGDEVSTTGRNSGRSPLELQLEWLRKVCKFAEENNRIPIVWDDMPLRHAEVYRSMFDKKMSVQTVDSIWESNEHKLSKFLDLFPKNCIYMRWNYASPQAYGNQKAMSWFRDHGLQVMGATAAQRRWVLMPQDEGNIINIRDFAINSIDKDINGLLCTLWDDDSPHFELYWRGILAFAEYTWAGNSKSIDDFKASYRHRSYSHTLSDSSYAFIDRLEEPVKFWKGALLKRENRNYLVRMEQPADKAKAVIDFPELSEPGKWSKDNKGRIEQAQKALETNQYVEHQINKYKNNTIRSEYTLQVYEQVNKLTRFSAEVLLAMEKIDKAENEGARNQEINEFRKLLDSFQEVRNNFEAVYGQTRILEKPSNYILDQDHHVHLANQAINFDWQFYAEILFVQKMYKQLESFK
ncbi:glycoside hydrolase family 20 zincin-like fold domain-containing protein [Tamlana sp. 2201CG12-4]|uniref:glycoside hydrolase family 20 zincin-like fold domain-containing protein n=1 Tax=Tamlana sp. 2201CG12-4 TaxID=3112582 RepID=UPI002DB73834|nr:glycoside hydrolase family 20 zincin-like fold domain-containing protein [Tamlana sp. 2201CG12-4]MEC3908233.1 glycoside hydrolase family 20 zincin-like fold domain-containing protein [Tamlana sp. 2201CG12-4]